MAHHSVAVRYGFKCVPGIRVPSSPVLSVSARVSEAQPVLPRATALPLFSSALKHPQQPGALSTP
jgi:hypothetical protein